MIDFNITYIIIGLTVVFAIMMISKIIKNINIYRINKLFENKLKNEINHPHIEIINDNWAQTIALYDKRIREKFENGLTVINENGSSRECNSIINIVVPQTNPVIDNIVDITDDHIVISLPEKFNPENDKVNVLELPWVIYIVLEDYMRSLQHYEIYSNVTDNGYLARTATDCEMAGL